MKLDLTMEEVACCESVGNVVLSHEETMETAIPEYCPGMARIVDSVGRLTIREKTLSEGQLVMTGTVRVTVLYTSEDAAGLRSLQMTVPFTCRSDDGRLQGCRHVCVSGRLPLVEARAITTRKLYIRVLAEFVVEGIVQKGQAICRSVGDEPSVQAKEETVEANVLTAVLEREFGVQEEFRPESGPAPEDLLLDQVFLRMTECRRVGRRLLVKGEAAVSVLYRTEEQTLRSWDTVLPFTQMLEGAELPEEAVYRAEGWLADGSARLTRTEEGAGFGLSLRLGVLVKVYELRKLRFISDLYSTRYASRLEHRPLRVVAAYPAEEKRQEAVEPLEFGREPAFACLTGAECGGVSTEEEGDHGVLRTNLRLKILYLDESGSPVSAERLAEVKTEVPNLPHMVRAMCAPGIVQLSGGSCQLRLPVDFSMEREEARELETVSAVELSEAEEGERPSLVLRRVERAETLWDIGKAYRTDPRLIVEANGLTEGEPLPEGMLLIPKTR